MMANGAYQVESISERIRAGWNEPGGKEEN